MNHQFTQKNSNSKKILKFVLFVVYYEVSMYAILKRKNILRTLMAF